MTDCRQILEWIHPYIDNELCAENALGLEAHLMDCPACRAEYDAVRSVVDTVRGARPLYEVPARLERRTDALVWTRHRTTRYLRWVAAVLIIGMSGLLLWWRAGHLGRSRFATFAADTHLRYARGVLPLDVRTSEPKAVSAWLQNRVPFHVVLPNYPAGPDQDKPYTLVGARLLQFEDADVAYLSYTMGHRPISLLIGSSSSVHPAGGTAYQSGRLAFYVSSAKSLDLITWEDHGLTYALVSDVAAGRAESCVVCHGTAEEREKIRELKPVR